MKHTKDLNKYAKIQPVQTPKVGGYPQTDIKTSGIKIRGTGAATKGTKARGPMA